MSKRRSSQQDSSTEPSGSRPVVSRQVSLAFVAVALVIFFVVQAGVGNLGSSLGSPTAGATTVSDGGGEQDGAGASTPQPGEVAVETASVPPADSQGEAAAASGTAVLTAMPLPTPTANAPPAQRASDLPTIAYGELPPEAHDTIRLIDAGGPFPFDKDGSTFQNREGILPGMPQGYYREYTVITPGEDDRGARRIVGGDAGELYYTADHYGSFREIMR